MSIYEFNPDDARRFGQEQHIKYKEHGNELQFKYCPYCRNKTSDKDTFSINLDTGQFKCLRASCGAKGNMLTLSRDFGFSLGRDVDEYYGRQRKYRDLSRYPKPDAKDAAIKYMESRGISKEVTERYGITTQKTDDNILVMPFFDEDGKMQFVKYRNMTFKKGDKGSKEWSQKDCKPILYGMDQCDPEVSDTLVMTEGQMDSLSCTEAGIPNAVSVPTGAMGFTWVPYCWDFMGKYQTLIVFGDHENGHITLLDEMSKKFHGKVMHVRPEDYKDCKDANDLLRRYGKQAVRDAVANAVIVEHPRIKAITDIKRVNMAQLERISTGIKQLDKKTGGLYFGQLVILTGESGLGKSTLGSQIIASAISQRYTTMCYSGELTGFLFQSWLDRQVAGEHVNQIVSPFEDSVWCVDGSVLPKIDKWYKDYVYVYDNTYIDADDGEMPSLIDTLQTSITQYGCRVLLIDNLMTAMADDMAVDFYRQQSAFVRKLANMAKAFNVIIILVAHPRKASGDFSNDDVAGSSNVTNLADVVLRYTKPKEDSRNPDPDPPDRVLQITKNRMNGNTDFKGIKLWYKEASKRISEDKNVFDWSLGWEDDEDDWKDIGMEDLPF